MQQFLRYSKIITVTVCISCCMQTGKAQKNFPVNRSTLTGIALPDGARQDKRMLITAAANIVMEDAGKKNNVTLKGTEVLYLPLNYTIDSLTAGAQKSGWKITADTTNKNFYWLQQGGKYVLANFFKTKKENNIYFAQSNQPPSSGSSTQAQTATQKPVTAVTQQTNTPAPVINSSFKFTTTNFDDGWASTVKEDWVEVTKSSIKILLHYPNKKADAYNSVLKEEDYTAWNTLVAPRYSNMKNFEWKSIQSWQSISFIEADATENASGKTVHIVFFKKHYSNGSGRYLEFVSNTKADYENEFGAYHNNELDWDKTANMQYRNKFSVAADDLIGSWSTTDYASVSYYYVNTGGLAGTTSTATADEFNFSEGNNYQSQHSGASGMVGNMKFSNQVYKGKSTVTNWNIILTNRFEGATEKYDAYFEAIKGGRVLLMTDRLKTTHALVKK